MKRSLKLRSNCRFTLVLVLLLATAGWVGSVSAAGQPERLKSGSSDLKAPPAVRFASPVADVARLPAVAAPIAARVAQPVPAKGVQAKAGGQQAAPAAPGQAVPIVRTKGLPVVLPHKTKAAAQTPPTEAKESPEHVSAIVKKTSAFLAAPKFTFLPDKALDPFVPFVSLQTTNDNIAPGGGPLTPLQKMTLAEMEKGLKAIVWGGLGRMAVIEDSTGKGYLVDVGTPAGPNGGVITKIDDNSLVIQQEVWNSQTRKRVPEDFTVKMVKKDSES